MKVGCGAEIAVSGRDYSGESRDIHRESRLYLLVRKLRILKSCAGGIQKYVHPSYVLDQFVETANCILFCDIDDLIVDPVGILILYSLQPVLAAGGYAHMK